MGARVPRLPKKADPELELFQSDEWRYRAYRWKTTKEIVNRICITVAGVASVLAVIVETLSIII